MGVNEEHLFVALILYEKVSDCMPLLDPADVLQMLNALWKARSCSAIAYTEQLQPVCFQLFASQQ